MNTDMQPMNAIYSDASRHYDFLSKVQFDPASFGGVFLGLAVGLTEKQVAAIEGRVGFTILTDQELKQMLEQDFTPAAPSTGDPIADSGSAYDKLPWNELLKLAKSRGVELPERPNKASVLAALKAAEDPLQSAPEPPKGSEG